MANQFLIRIPSTINTHTDTQTHTQKPKFTSGTYLVLKQDVRSYLYTKFTLLADLKTLHLKVLLGTSRVI